MAALSNQYLATHRSNSSGGDYVKIYELENGKLLATHEATGGFGRLKEHKYYFSFFVIFVRSRSIIQ